MEIIRIIEMTKEEHNILDKILNDFNKSSITNEYCIGEAINEMIENNKNYIKDFKINEDDMGIIKKALNWFWLIPDMELGENVSEFISNLITNDFDTYEIKIIL